MSLRSTAPSALDLELRVQVMSRASRLRPSVSSISNCDPSREACRASVTPSLLGRHCALSHHVMAGLDPAIFAPAADARIGPVDANYLSSIVIPAKARGTLAGTDGGGSAVGPPHLAPQLGGTSPTQLILEINGSGHQSYSLK